MDLGKTHFIKIAFNWLSNYKLRFIIICCVIFFRAPQYSLSLQQWALLIINSLQIFILQLDVCFLFLAPLNVWTFLSSYVELIDAVDKNSKTLEPFYLTKNVLLTAFPFLICVHLFHVFLVFTAWYAFAHALILMASYGTCCYLYAFLLFKQNYQALGKALSRALKSVSRSDKNRSKVTRLGYVATTLESNATNFCVVFLFDRFISLQLLIYLSLHMPMSALFVMEILVGENGNNKAVSQLPMTRFIKIGLVLEAIVGSLVLHLRMAHFSSYIHQGGKMLMNFSAHFRCERLSVRSRLLIWRHAQRLWVRREFGVTYGGKEKGKKLEMFMLNVFSLTFRISSYKYENFCTGCEFNFKVCLKLKTFLFTVSSSV